MNDIQTLAHCGFVGIVGRPNVGKSTLMNNILGQKISITSRKPQTTRHQIRGIKSTDTSQVVYVDTPGLHKTEKRAMNKVMNRTASNVIRDVDVVVFVTEAMQWRDEDAFILEKLLRIDVPVVLVINKVDTIEDKGLLLPHIEKVAGEMSFANIIPLSAKQGMNVAEFEKCVTAYLPESPPFFPLDQVTDQSERFLASELIREKLMRRLGAEIPYSLTVELEKFAMEKKILHISAVIWVERDSQKAIVIGKQGAGLKEIGKQARIDMENVFGHKIFLELWVKTKDKWADDVRALHGLGYTD